MSDQSTHDIHKVNQIASHYEAILRLIGENPQREGLIKTPVRAAKALLDITGGYSQDPQAIVQKAIFNHDGSQMIIVKDIEFYSMCEHHILPFFGTIDVGYIPDGKIVGLSKLARLVDCFAKQLQVQERLTGQICDALAKALPNKGVIVKCTAQHLCMKMRGVEKQDAATVTFDYNGKFLKDLKLREEFLQLTK